MDDPLIFTSYITIRKFHHFRSLIVHLCFEDFVICVQKSHHQYEISLVLKFTTGFMVKSKADDSVKNAKFG